MGGLLGGRGGQRVCWPPSQIIGGAGPPAPPPPPLPTPMHLKMNGYTSTFSPISTKRNNFCEGKRVHRHDFLSFVQKPGRVAQSVGHLARKSGVLDSISGPATYFCFSFRFFKKGSCQLLAKVCARSTG